MLLKLWMTGPMIAVLPSTIFTIFVSYLPTLTLNWSLNSLPGLMTTRAQSQRSLVYSLLRSQHAEQDSAESWMWDRQVDLIGVPFEFLVWPASSQIREKGWVQVYYRETSHQREIKKLCCHSPVMVAIRFVCLTGLCVQQCIHWYTTWPICNSVWGQLVAFAQACLEEMAAGALSIEQVRGSMRGMKLCATTQEQLLKLRVFGLFIRLCHLIGWKGKYSSSAPLYPADDRRNLWSDCFLSAPAPLLFSGMLRCARTVCTARAVAEEHGVTGCSAPLSNPPKQITKSCILSTDPCDNTARAAFEKYVNLLWTGALHSCTIHPSQASVGTHKCVCMLGLALNPIILPGKSPHLCYSLAPDKWERAINGTRA